MSDSNASFEEIAPIPEGIEGQENEEESKDGEDTSYISVEKDLF